MAIVGITPEEEEFLTIYTAFTSGFTSDQHKDLAKLLGQANKWGQERARREMGVLSYATASQTDKLMIDEWSTGQIGPENATEPDA